MAKNGCKILSRKKIGLEFIITIFIAAVLFFILNKANLFKNIYDLSSERHSKYDRGLLFSAFIAVAVMIFALRRWLELKKVHNQYEQINESLRFQAKLLDEIGDGLIATDIEGNITYLNQRSADWIKKDKNEVIGRHVSVLGQDDSFGTTQNNIIQTTLTEGSWFGEISNIASDNSKVFLECNTWQIKDKAGQVIGMCGVSRDITERTKKRLEIEKHKKYLEALDKASGVLLESIASIDYDGFLAKLGSASNTDRILFLEKKISEDGQPQIANTAVWRADDSVKSIQIGKVDEFFTENLWPIWKKIFTDGKPVCVRIENTSGKEKQFWQSVGLKSMLAIPVIVDSQLQGFISFDNCYVSRDWTESEIEFLSTAAKNLAIAIKRMDYKNELKQQRDFAQRLIETAQAIVLVLDKEGNIVMFNQYLERLAGYKLCQVKGKNWFETFLPEQCQKKMKSFFDGAIKDIELKAHINPILTKNGRKIHIEWHSRPLRDYDGNILGLLSTGQDITERLEAEEQLKQAHSQLEQRVYRRTAELQKTNMQLLKTIAEKDHIQKILKETEKIATAGKLAAQIAHEINNPLAGIKNSFLLIKGAIPTEHKYYNYVGRIEKEINRVSGIVRQMFDLYRPDTVSAERFRLYDVINDIVQLLKVAVAQKYILVEIDCSQDIIITLSEALLRQVLYNIIQNAIQACQNDAKISVLARKQDKKLFIAISDCGRGIDDSIRSRVFEPFFTTGLGGPNSGLGLGLAITKDIVNAMDGTIDFVSRKGEGTTFNIMIPLTNE